MSDEKIPGIMRDFVKAMAEGDVEKMLSFVTEDAVWTNPNGTFRGKAEVKRYLTVLLGTMRDVTVTECGNGIIVQGNKAFFEHVIAGTIEGKRGEGLAMCAYEFSDDKIKEVRTTYDRLLMSQQVAPWFGKWMVNFIVKQAEKGLH
jgi:ketosteroid isomerase-like protein